MNDANITEVKFTIMAIDTNNCNFEDSVRVIVASSIKVFTALTPNNDGDNDYWRIENAEQYPDAEVAVFNRSGQKIYYSKGYNNDDEKKRFNGTRNGKDLPIGVYYYIITLSDGSKPYTGTLTLVR
jgi:gliding motility-associated-like protein